MPPEPLLDRDVEVTYRHAVATWALERLDTRWGTALVVAFLKHGGDGSWGWCSRTDDGPYSDGKNHEYFSHHGQRGPKGFHVKIIKTVRATDTEEVLREGTVSWNRLANMTTIRALEIRRARGEEEVEQDGQLAIF